MKQHSTLSSSQLGFIRAAHAAVELDVQALSSQLNLRPERVRRWLAETEFAESFRGARFAHRDEMDWAIQRAATEAVAKLRDIAFGDDRGDPDTRETRRRGCVDLIRAARHADARLRLAAAVNIARVLSDQERIHPSQAHIADELLKGLDELHEQDADGCASGAD